MFVGREAELYKLGELYEGNQFQFVALYGRRRVGKTSLIREFSAGKKAVYFLAREADGAINLHRFSSDVYSVTSEEQAGNSSFTDWEKAFEYIGKISEAERIILAIDEYPYLAAGYQPISSILQANIDLNFKNGKLFLMLCGSSMSFMENQVLGYKSPLYGRRTAQLKILPFTFFESLPFLSSFTKEEQAVLYGATGGIPEYLTKIEKSKSVSENLINLFFNPSGALFEEPSNLLKQELREPSTYNGIIDAIAGGASRLNEIATKCMLESNKCAKYLKSLISLGIVRKEMPVTEKISKKSIYLLNDMMFRFWYRFVFPNMSSIVSGLGRAVYEAEVSGELSAYMGLVFEDICRQYLVEEAKKDKLPFLPGDIGRWWGNNPHEKRQEEIDIMTFRKDRALFCECKWTNSPVDAPVFSDLKRKAELFSYGEKWLYIFSKSGFTPKLISDARGYENVKLVSLDDMLK